MAEHKYCGLSPNYEWLKGEIESNTDYLMIDFSKADVGAEPHLFYLDNNKGVDGILYNKLTGKPTTYSLRIIESKNYEMFNAEKNGKLEGGTLLITAFKTKDNDNSWAICNYKDFTNHPNKRTQNYKDYTLGRNGEPSTMNLVPFNDINCLYRFRNGARIVKRREIKVSN